MEQAPKEREPNYERLRHIDELLLEQGIDLSASPEEIAARGIYRVNFYQQGIKNAEGKHETHDLAAIELRPEMVPSGWQAEPARITPSRAQPPKRDHEVLFVFSDPQIGYRRVIDGKTGEQEMIPLHDESAIRAAQMLCKYLKPDQIWNLGDTIDYPSISRFAPDSDHFFKTMGPSHQAVHDMYAQFRADNPDTPIKEVGSNHVDRFMQRVLKQFPEAYDMYRPADDSEYPVMSYPYMANLEHLGVDFIGGGQEAEIVYGEDYTEVIEGREYRMPPLLGRHGTETGQDGKAATKVMRRNLGFIALQGHAHTEQLSMRVNEKGQRIGVVMVPPLCRTTGEVSSYHSSVTEQNRVRRMQEEWPQGVQVVENYNGHYVFNMVPIINGIIRYRGREFDGNE